MASSTRRKASNIFVWIILALLILGLAGFGVSNFGGTVQQVASVGETSVSPDAYARALQAELRRRSGPDGAPLTMQEAQALGLERMVLQRLMAEAALDEAARRAGLSVGDEAVRREVLSIPSFRGPDGEFDRTAYTETLSNNGLSVGQFEATIRRELARELYQTATAAGLAAQPVFGRTVAAYLAEARDIAVAEIGPDVLAEPVAPPSQAEIEAYYEANAAAFTRPASKEITYAWAIPEMLSGEVAVDEADLRALYEARRGEFVRPERRLVERLVFPDQAAAEAAAAALTEGEQSFDDLVAARGLELADIDLSAVTQAELGEAGRGVFALTEPGVAGPLPSPLGPALFRVNAILAPQRTPFEEARAGLRAELAEARAQERIEAEIEALDDLLAGGATLEEIAAESDLRLGRIAWTGAEDGGIAAYDRFARRAEAVTADDFPEIELLPDGGVFALRLDREVPPLLPPLEEIRAEVAAAAAVEKRRAAILEEAEALADQLTEGADPQALDLAPERHAGLTRRDAGAVGGQVLNRAFALSEGQAGAVATQDGVRLVLVERVRDAGAPDAEARLIAQAVRQQASQGMVQDLLGEIATAIQIEAGVSLDQTAITAVQNQLP